MTVTHLLFAVLTTAYILMAIRFEERDLIRAFPDYADYRNRVPMLIPGLPRRSAGSARRSKRSAQVTQALGGSRR